MRCLIVDKMHDCTLGLLSQIGVEAVYKPDITREEIINQISVYEGLMIRSKTNVDHELLQDAKRLKFVARAGAGVDNLDEQFLIENKIEIINAPEGNRNAVGEHTVGLLLNLLNKISRSDAEVRKYKWDREGNRGYELRGQTVAIMGYGNMGQAFAGMLRSFGCEVIVYDKYKTGFGNELCQEVTLKQVFRQADIFSIHVPLTTETRGMVDAQFINNFERNIYLLNTARGEIVKLKDLCQAIESGKVIGAGLDVLENEKLNSLDKNEREYFDYLVKSDKTILTPHIAGWSYESYQKISEVLVAKIKDRFGLKVRK